VLKEFLGGIQVRVETEVSERVKRPGVAVGLAWTPAGGDILFIEANKMKGKGGFTMTGQIGEVMQESMQAALTWVRSNAASLGSGRGLYQGYRPAHSRAGGAIPKDGPSAGVTMATVLASLLTDTPVRPLTAMTGEITLSGNVLPVGGIKEKFLAARRAGVTTIILPADNRQDVEEDLTPELMEGVTVHYASRIEDVLAVALPFLQAPARHQTRRTRAGGEHGGVDVDELQWSEGPAKLPALFFVRPVRSGFRLARVERPGAEALSVPAWFRGHKCLHSLRNFCFAKTVARITRRMLLFADSAGSCRIPPAGLRLGGHQCQFLFSFRPRAGPLDPAKASFTGWRLGRKPSLPGIFLTRCLAWRFNLMDTREAEAKGIPRKPPLSSSNRGTPVRRGFTRPVAPMRCCKRRISALSGLRGAGGRKWWFPESP
jgi:hypothetical protein